MKIRNKLCVWLIIIITALITIITIILIRQASGASYYLGVRNLEHLTSQRIEYWKGVENGYIRTLHTLANLMGDYESVKAEERRDRYDNMLKSVLEAEPGMAALYTVWKPNAVDGMDSRYIGRIGSSPSGQYAMAYFVESNKITGRTSGEIDNVIAYLSGPNAHKDRVDNPSQIKIKGKNKYIVKITVPVTNNRTKKIVGGLGCYLIIDTMQNILENTLRSNNEIAMMAMYSSNGTILAHLFPNRIGKRMLDVDAELGDSSQEMFRAMQEGKPYMDTVYQPELKENVIFVMKPFQIGNSGHYWSMLIGVPESYILKEVKDITKFSILLIAAAFLITTIAIFSIVCFFTKPIVKIKNTLFKAA